ncbi:MAG: hypothetical protein AVDCRST_MAG40-1345, partial [uncultured Gemmatimonadaceae bacterium]
APPRPLPHARRAAARHRDAGGGAGPRPQQRLRRAARQRRAVLDQLRPAARRRRRQHPRRGGELSGAGRIPGQRPRRAPPLPPRPGAPQRPHGRRHAPPGARGRRHRRLGAGDARPQRPVGAVHPAERDGDTRLPPAAGRRRVRLPHRPHADLRLRHRGGGVPREGTLLLRWAQRRHQLL